jgi:subtilisin
MTGGGTQDYVKPLRSNLRKMGCATERVRGLLACVQVGLLFLFPIGSAIAGVVPEALHQKASSEGSVRVIVQLRVPSVPEGQLRSTEAIASQRQDIASTRSVVLTELAGTNYRTIREFETIPFVALEVGPDALLTLEASPGVVGVEEDHLLRPLLSQSVPLIGAPQAWAAGFDGTGMVIAILDSGVDKNHPFLAGKVVEEACFSSNGSCPNGLTSQLGSGAALPCTYSPSECFHGTFVAGIAAGAGVSFSGVAKGAHLIAVQVESRQTGSSCTGRPDPCPTASLSDVMMGLERVFALKNQYAIAAVNISLGGMAFTSTSACDSVNAGIKAMIDNLRSAGIATVIASGNDGFANAISSPACISTAVSVGATTKADTVWPSSNSAAFLSLLAPGVSITSSVPGGAFGVATGTSFAAPHVAGAWAIVKQRKPTATVTEILNTLTSTGLAITDPKNGITKPRIRVDQALQALCTPGIPLINGVPISGSVPQGFFTDYCLVVPSGATQLSVTLNGTGDVDLYVRFAQLPQLSAFDCRSDSPTGNESCLISNPSPGTWFIRVHGFDAGLHFFTLTAAFPDPTSSFVTRLYLQVLSRQPDPAGLLGFTAQIQQFGSVVPTVFAFFHSAEFLNRNTSNFDFLTILYHTLLNRDPDFAGFIAFFNDLNSGLRTRDNLIDIFIDSAEFANLASFLPPQDPVTAFVTNLYVRILGRGPDLPGLQGFVAQLQQTRTVLPTVLVFLHSPEFLARNTSNAEYVTVLYRVFLDRVPDATGLASFVALLNAGSATRDQLAAQFAASPEFQAIQHQLFP